MSYRLMCARSTDLAGIGAASRTPASLLLFLFDLAKRSCNEKTSISVSRTGKQLPPLRNGISDTQYRQL